MSGGGVKRAYLHEIVLNTYPYIQYIQGKTPDEVTKMVTPSRQQAIQACKDIETNPGPYGPEVVRVLRNTRLMLEGMTDGQLADEMAKAGH